MRLKNIFETNFYIFYVQLNRYSQPNERQELIKVTRTNVTVGTGRLCRCENKTRNIDWDS